jgi:hypothetical protein
MKLLVIDSMLLQRVLFILGATLLYSQYCMAIEPINQSGKSTCSRSTPDEVMEPHKDNQRERKLEALERLRSTLARQKSNSRNKDALQRISQMQKELCKSTSEPQQDDDGLDAHDSHTTVERQAEIRAKKRAEREAYPTYSEEMQLLIYETQQSDIADLP